MSLDDALEYFQQVESNALVNTDISLTSNNDFEKVSSLGEAIKRLVSKETDDIKVAGRNELTAFVSNRALAARIAGEKADDWNDYARTTASLNLDFLSVFEKDPITNLPTSVQETAKQEFRARFFISFLGIASDSLEASTFFVSVAKCLRNGHLPAGWVGVYPEGKLLVF